MTASFSDTDGNYRDCSGSDGPVSPAAASSATAVSDNASSTTTGGTLVFTATVSGPGGTPAGSVAWSGSCSSTTDLTAGVATCSITGALASSSYSETASFTDTDGNYSDSSGSDGPVSPAAASSATVVSDNAASTTTGGTLVFTATVSGPGGTPAGSVAWSGSACLDHRPHRRGRHLLDHRRTCLERLQRDGHLHRHRRQLLGLLGL